MKRFFRSFRLYLSSPFSNTSRLISVIFRKRTCHGPLMASVSITSRCHTHCLMCWYHSPLLKEREDFNKIYLKELSFETIEKIFWDFNRLGVKRVFISGEGEPLNHPRITDILRLCRDYGFELFLLTNITNLTPDKAHLLYRSGLVHVIVSSHGVSPEIMTEVYPVLSADRIQEGMAGFKELIKIRDRFGYPRVEVIHVIFKQNINDLEEMIKQAVDLKVNKLTLKRGIFNSELKEKLNPVKEELEQAFGTIRKHSKIKIRNNMAAFIESLNEDSFSDFKKTVAEGEMSGGPALDNYRFCYIPYLSTNIESDGTVKPCIYDAFAPNPGNVNTQNFYDIWFSSRYQNYRKTRKCPICLAFSLYPFMNPIKKLTGFFNRFSLKR
ncbi:MAG TPA: radical SAM protein [Firmicutes bacterium]|nr:radical SAM protein [Bacillota bacterium]